MTQSLLLVYLFLVFSKIAYSGPSSEMEKAYQALSQKPANYQVEGAICEQLMGLHLEETYPPSDYDIKIGIMYTSGGHTLGELDVVVFDRLTNEAVKIVEVKCSYNPRRLLSKAKAQLKRFKDNVAGDKPLEIFDVHDKNNKYSMERFDEEPLYETGSVEGSRDVGYDIALIFEKDEALEIRRRLMACQKRGQCPTL